TDYPTQRPAFAAYCFLQEHQAFQKSVWPRWAARNVHVDRQKLIYALDHTVDVIHATRISTRSHGNDPARFHHLFIEPLNHGRHFDEDGSSDYHQVGFPRRTA